MDGRQNTFEIVALFEGLRVYVDGTGGNLFKFCKVQPKPVSSCRERTIALRPRPCSVD